MKKDFWVNFALLCGSVLFVLVLLECGVRLLVPKERVYGFPDILVSDSFTNYRLAENFSSRMSSREFDVEISTNSLGFRDDEFVAGRPAILLLGDSFGFGWGVKHTESFAFLLENLSGMQVVNAGVPGYGTFHEFNLLRKHQDLINPKIVVVAFVANDGADSLVGEARAERVYKGYLVRSKESFFAKLQSVLYRNFRSFVFFGRIITKLRAVKSADSVFVFSDAEKNASLTYLSKIHELSGDSLVLVLVPDKTTDDNTFLFVEEFAKARSIPVVKPIVGKDLFFVYDGHFGKQGHVIVADAVYETLLNKSLIVS